MFSGCELLECLNLSSFDTRNVKDMSRMFYDCKSLNYVDLYSFNTDKVYKIKGIFYNSEKILDANYSKFKKFDRAEMKSNTYD